MTKLSDTQSIILSAATQRSDGNVLPLPGSLRGGAAGKLVKAMLTRGLVREQVTGTLTEADAALNTIWRNEADGRAVLLRITPAGLEAIGVEREGGQDDASTDAADPGPAGEPAATGPSGATEAAIGSQADRDAAEREAAPAARTAAPAGKTREGSKQACVGAARFARNNSNVRACDRVRACVRPVIAAFQAPRAGMVMRGSDPNLSCEL